VSGQVEPLRLLEKGKLLMEEQSYREALEAFRSLAQHDATLLPIVWQGRALKRLGRLSDAIEVLKEGLRLRSASDDSFRRAVALWNLACYRSLMNKDSLEPNFVRSVIELLKEALQNAPEFRESLATENLDRDLVPLLGNPVFEQWRSDLLTKRGDL
jgi:tetratricopeptide (TPR) repeat protein